MARDFLPRQDVQIADPSGRTTTPFYVWMQSLERAFGALDVDLAAMLEQIEQLKPGQKVTIDGAMSVIVANVDGTITISLDGDNDSPGGNWYYGTNEAGVRGFWPIADGVSGGYSITKAVDYGPYDFQGELDTPDDLPSSVVVGDAYLINGDLWVGADDGGDDGPGWDNLGPAPTTAVLSLINDEATPDPTHYYGTDSAGNKGWHPVSDAVEAATGELTKTVGGDGVTTFGLPDVTPTPGGTLQRYGFDAKGRRSEEEAADTDDLAEGSSNLYFTDARADARITAQKGQPNGLATLDADAKLEANQLPALAITDTFVVNTEAAMLALDAQQGDVAVRTDEQKSYILTADPASTLGNWQELLTPTGTGGTVTSVALSVPTGLTVSGSPITSSGTITVNYDTGYQGYTSAEASKLSGIEVGATVGADWSVNLSNIPANIASWAGIAPSAKVNTAGDTMTGHLVIANGGELRLDNSAGTIRLIRWLTNGVNRWAFYTNTAAESGGNAGSNLTIRRYADDGSAISPDPLNINRATGVVSLAVRPTFAGAVPWDSANFDPSEVVPSTVAPTLPGENWDTQSTVGFFRATSSYGGTPPDASTSGDYDVIQTFGSNGDGTQLAFFGPKEAFWRLQDSGPGTWGPWNEFWHTGNLADSGWQTLTLSNSWTNQGGSPTYGPAACRRFGAHVMLRGLLVPGTTTDGTTMFTLPVGYRPATAMRFPVVSNGANPIPQLQVNTDGTVQCFGLAGNTAAITVAHISFFTD